MSQWMPCVFEYASQTGKIVGSPYEASLIERAENLMLTFHLPASPKMEDKRLHVLGVRVGLSFADSANRVLRVQVRGIKDSGADCVWEHIADVTNPQRIEHNIGSHDMSGYHAVKVLVYFTGSTQHAIRVGYVSAHIQYA